MNKNLVNKQELDLNNFTDNYIKLTTKNSVYELVRSTKSDRIWLVNSENNSHVEIDEEIEFEFGAYPISANKISVGYRTILNRIKRPINKRYLTLSIIKSIEVFE